MMYHHDGSHSPPVTEKSGPKSTTSRNSVGGGGFSSDTDGESSDTDGESSDDSHSVMSHTSLLQRAQRERDSKIRMEQGTSGNTEDGKELDTGADPGPERNGDNDEFCSDNKEQPNDDLSQRPVCLVVGAGPGIGTSVASRFAREGYATAVARRDGQTLKDIVHKIRNDEGAISIADDVPIVPYQCDAREEEEVVDLFHNVIQTLGRIDVCVFNIGSNISYPLVETSAQKFRKCWEMGCYSGFLVGREAARHMLQRKSGGTIIFTGATASVRGAGNFSAFAVTKMGLRALAQSMARELGPSGIHVAHVVIDGVVDTPWIRKVREYVHLDRLLFGPLRAVY
jgi:NAD(P)-dependent dehydrogenase (short-subunit alcohol dehydrogenase family)